MQLKKCTQRRYTTGLLVSIVVLKDTGSNIKSIKEAANDWMQFSLAPDDPRCPCSHSAAASARSQHPHPELGRVWRSSLHALRGTQLTTHVRILAELRRHELGETGCGICWRAFWRTQMRTAGSARRPRRQGHKLVKTSVHSLCVFTVLFTADTPRKTSASLTARICWAHQPCRQRTSFALMSWTRMKRCVFASNFNNEEH